MESLSMSKKICVVTGASSGIGKATAGRLAEMGATVVMVCRNGDRGERAMGEVRKRSGNDSIELLLADFASLSSVRALAEEFKARHDSLHVLVNNVGVVKLRRSVTTDGLETTFQVNYLSHFLLTNLLLDVLKKSAPSRVVNVSSAAHFSGHLHLDNPGLETGYGVMKAYSQSKLAQVLFTHALARRLAGTGVTVNCLHPGAVATNMWGSPLGHLSFLGKISRIFLLSTEKGAETPVYLASSPEVEGVSGKYFNRGHVRSSSEESNDVELAEKLWTTSAAMAGLESATDRT